MSDRLLHALHVPSDAQRQSGSERQRQLSKRGAVDSDISSTESVRSQPGQQTISGQLRGRLAPLMAAEYEELFAASGVDTVPYTVRNGESQLDGYYAPENIGENFADARDDRIQSFDGVLTVQGSRRSHWRAVRSNPETLDNPFGSDATPEFGVSTRSRKVRWFDDTTGSLQDATVQRRVQGEHDFIEIYDASEPSFDRPVLLFDIPYTEEYPTDVTVWDTYDRDKLYQETSSADYQVGSATVGSATVTDTIDLETVQWQRVYVTDHDWTGDIIIETDRLRLLVDQPEDNLRVYQWNPSVGLWEQQQLGSSDWRLWDIDITHIGLVRVECQLEFENTTNGNKYNLNAKLLRGLDNALFTIPPNESAPAPSGVVDRLDPIAHPSDDVPNATMDIVPRTEVDR
jgi:hypothetical protein